MAQSSIYNWSNVDRPIPGWVESWLEHYKKSTKFEKIAEMIKKEIEDDLQIKSLSYETMNKLYADKENILNKTK